MVELFVRLLVAVAWPVAVSLGGGTTWIACALLASTGCLLGCVTQIATNTGHRNAGGAGILASLDAVWIAFALASTGHLDQFGFLVLAPIAYAAARFGSLPTAMAPLAASSLALAFAIFHPGKEPAASFYGQMAAVLTIGLLLNHRRIVVTESRPIVEAEVQASIEQGPPPEAFMELRESFRRLRDQYRDLSSLRARESRALDIYKLLIGTKGTFTDRLVRSIRQAHDLRGVAVFQPSSLSDRLTLTASEGTLPALIEDAGLPSNLRLAREQVLRSASDGEEEALLAHASGGSANLPLIFEGKVVGLLALFGEASALREAMDACNEVAVDLASSLAHDARLQNYRKRALSAETQFELASVLRGSITRNHLAARTALALRDICSIENLVITWLDDGERLLVASHGAKTLLPDALTLGEGTGETGWTAHGAPDIWMPSTHEDARVRPHDVVHTRQRSAALVAVRRGEDVIGFVSASSPRSGAVGAFEFDTIRMAALQLGQALLQLEGNSLQGGIAPLSELREALTRSPASMVVQLVPVQRERQAQTLGVPALEQAARAYVQRLSAKLPPGGLIASRAEGEFLVLLPGLDRKQAESWANESAAMASLVGIPVGDGTTRVPLAYRARVSSLGQGGSEAPESAVRETNPLPGHFEEPAAA
ncbi:MAG: hypothetical protein HZC36_10540 [Armatimonadetes bacterium]|nr:hypothetical protein [Armatimonadota bacterium]